MGKTTSQRQIRAYEKDILKIRGFKKKKPNGVEESDAEVIARIIQELEKKMQNITNVKVKFDGSFR